MKNNYFGHNLKFLRKSFNLSQQQLARIVGKTFTAVSRWEAGLREPSNKVVQTYAEHFGLTPADLMYRPTGGYIMFCHLLPSVKKWLFKRVFVIC